MKATGIVRRVDDLGRIVIPKEIRRTLRIRESDPLHTIFTSFDLFLRGVIDFAQRVTGKKCMETAADHQTGSCDYLFDKWDLVVPPSRI